MQVTLLPGGLLAWQGMVGLCWFALGSSESGSIETAYRYSLVIVSWVQFTARLVAKL